MSKKLLIIITVIALQLSTILSLAFANQTNHGQKVSEVAKSIDPGPTHGKTVSDAARSKSQSNSSLIFDGENDYVVVQHNNLYNLNPNFSIELWMKTSDISDGQIFSKHDYSTPNSIGGLGRGYFLWGWSTFNIEDSEGWKVVNYPYTGVIDGIWHHIAITSTGSHLRMYIDGQLKDEISVTGNYFRDNAPILIGAYIYPWKISGFKGRLDEFRIWNNKTLTQEEIQANMYKEIKPQEGLVGYWKFNEGSGDIAYDSSGNGNHGTIYGNPQWVEGAPFQR